MRQSLEERSLRVFVTKISAIVIVLFSSTLPLRGQTAVWDGGNATNDWHDSGNWDPDGLPTTSDLVSIDASLGALSQTIVLTDNVYFSGLSFGVDGLTIADGFKLNTSSFRLGVDDVNETALTEITGLGSELLVNSYSADPNDAAFHTDELLVKSNGVLRMQGGIAEVQSFAEIRAMGEIAGYGEVWFGNASASGTVLDNEGEIRVSSNPFALGGTLRIATGPTANVSATLNLSGTSGSGELTVNDNGAPIGDRRALRLVIDGQTEDFLGNLDIGGSDTAEFTNDLTLLGGTIEFNGDAGTATLTGTGDMIGIGATFDINSGTAEIDNDVAMGIASQVNIASNTNLILNGTYTDGSSGIVDVGSGASIEFNGIGNSITTELALGNNSQLIVRGDLTVAPSAAAFDWDGSNENADTTVDGAAALLSIVTLNVDPAADGHQADLTIMGGGQVEVTVTNASNLWIKEGSLQLMSDASGPESRLQTLDGDGVIFQGTTIAASGTGVSIIEGASHEFDGGVNVTATANATLRIKNGDYAGGMWGDGNGTLQNSVAMTVSGDTALNFATVDLDGPIGEAHVQLDRQLVINTAEINSDAGNVFGQHNGMATAASMEIAFLGRLEIDASGLSSSGWTIGENAVVELFAAGGGSEHVAGGDVEIAGTVNVRAGNSDWTARTTIGQSGSITIDAGTSWTLRGGSLTSPNRIEGGMIGGGGQIRASANRGLHGWGTVNATVNFSAANAELMAAGQSELLVSGNIVNVARLGTADVGGTLRLTNPFSTSTASDALVLNGGAVVGATVTNDGETRGFGRIASNNFVQNVAVGVLTAEGGTLELDTQSAAIDLTLGTINATTGSLKINKPLVAAFTGVANVGTDQRIEFVSGWNVSGAGVLNLNGGGSGGRAAIAGETSVGGGAVVNVTNLGVFEDRVTFANNAAVNISAATSALLLEGDAQIPFAGAATAMFTGNGALSNQTGSQLEIESEVNSINVELRNRGRLEIELAGPGRVGLGADFTQLFSGVTALDIEGLTPVSEYDRFVISGNATLDGTFSVLLGGGFTPTLGDAFDLLDFASATGTPSFSLPTLGGGLSWDTSQFVTNGILSVVASTLDCDFNGDANCDIDDLDLLYAQLGTTGGGVFDLNGNGAVDDDDITEWLLQASDADPLGRMFVPGDSDLDGTVGGADFTTVASNFGTTSATWGMGNFDGLQADVGAVGGSDFTALASNFGFVSVSSIVAVPEPSTSHLMMVIAVIAAHRAYRKTGKAAQCGTTGN